MSTIEEWLVEAKKGTNEDMVYPILGDWQKDRVKFLEGLEMLKKSMGELEVLEKRRRKLEKGGG